MSIRIAIRHRTRYLFDREVTLSPHEFRLRPAPHTRTPIESYTLSIKPEDKFFHWNQDPFGNFIARVVFPNRCRTLEVEVEIIADMTAINPLDFFLEEEAEEIPFEYSPQLKRELRPYLEIDEEGPHLLKWLKGVDVTPRRTIIFLSELNQKLWKEIGYTIRMESGVQSCEETLSRQTGSCRDSAWVLVQALRHLGMAARFVSGYLVQLTADEKSLDGPSGPATDFTDLHAWCEVFVPGAGWIGLDPTSGLFAGEGHIPLACAPHYESAAPVIGFTDKCETRFEFENTVDRIVEHPRTTKPFSEEQWQAIDQLGQKVEADLIAQDVRLSMGGEPTFVSIDDMDGPEWTIAADGPFKRERAIDLLFRLSDRFSPGAMIQFGQGKWYPGEELPRWRYGCYWRRDGHPLWKDRAWLANPAKEGTVTLDDVGRFSSALAQRLGGIEKHLQPAFEDPAYYLWEEANMPVDLDPLKADLDDPLERRRLARLLSQGLGKPVGYLLPLGRDPYAEQWLSGDWHFRRKRLYLIPGDSAMGFRLPLGRLEAHPPGEEPEPIPRCTFEPRSELKKKWQVHQSRQTFVRTALCLEWREGRLHLFLPPFEELEGFLALVEAIEEVAAELKIPVVPEGYSPPEDPRINRFFITPDPGVIEVNIHPSLSWEELRDKTIQLYEEARLARLGTEKFLLDGRHTGTGGGNHITLGGPTPADSPLLRKPDLLASLITFWQNHPGLSYLFSGLFIGPTSQAPRVDEARDEGLHELEIALSQIPPGEIQQPWLADRLLRHHLVDLTGNTHRAEFCIDKLYSPSGPTGRLGLLELRAFEMPPHARMSLVQALLLRTLVAWFWKQPYRHPLIRWGTALHDQFMLPFFVQEDLKQVTEALNRAGYPFDIGWLAPFFEFRFPRLGEVIAGPITLELRQGLEPWHVLGEEVTAQGTSRFVDSSVERIQVRLKGMVPDRYAVACNGFKLPLRTTGAFGDYVAGVRYKAWQPPSGMHPLLPNHSRLVFDIIDLWNQRSIGGCSYFVAHPGGLSHDTFPINALEAESRRHSRYWSQGHTPGPIERPPVQQPSTGQFIAGGSGQAVCRDDSETVRRDFTTTLDLRARSRQKNE